MAQRAREGAPEHPNEQSAAPSPEDAATCPNGHLSQSAAKKGTHKKRREQAFKNFIYQHIFNKDRFTNIFKKKNGHNAGGKHTDQHGNTGRNQEDVCEDNQLSSDEEEYMLFLSYIYNDITSFIEINKNYHLENSNYADLEDLILEICGTACRDAFRNIKSIFKSPGQGSVCERADHGGVRGVNDCGEERHNHEAHGDDLYHPDSHGDQRYHPDSHGDKGTREALRSHPPSASDSSFFFIPPMECLVTHIHKLTSKKGEAHNDCKFASDVNEFLKNNGFDRHPIYGSLQRGDKPREEGEAEKAEGAEDAEEGEEADPSFHAELPAPRGETPRSLGQSSPATHEGARENGHSHLSSHPSGYATLEAELPHAHTGGEEQPPCSCSGGSNYSRRDCTDHLFCRRLHSEVDSTPPTHSQEGRLLLEDATEEITTNEKKHDEEGAQHAHSPPEEHTQGGTNFEVSSNNGRDTICVHIHNCNENEATWAHRKSPDEFTSSFLNGKARSVGGGAIYSAFSGPNCAPNFDSNDGLPNGPAQGNSPPDGAAQDDYNDDDDGVGSVEEETTGDPFLRGELLMNGSLQGGAEAHREIHHQNHSDHSKQASHFISSDPSKQASRSNRDDDVFEDCLDDYVKPARAPNDSQDTDTNDDDSEADADSEEHDVAAEVDGVVAKVDGVVAKVDGVASEVDDANGANAPSEDHPPDEQTDVQTDEQTSNNVRRGEDIQVCGGQGGSQLGDDEEGIPSEGKDPPKGQSPKEHTPKGLPPQRIIELDQKEYLEKQQKMVKNKTYADPESRREFPKNKNPHDDYYHYKYFNSCENVSNPYRYTKVGRKANIQVTPSPFPQFLRDIQIYNISQKKIRLKKTNIALRRDDADTGIPEKTTSKKKRHTRKRTE
ncbi:unnamed protein product [Plasmodium vivax]|nr:unnamed protein product [Plasmodium vivax]